MKYSGKSGWLMPGNLTRRHSCGSIGFRQVAHILRIVITLLLTCSWGFAGVNFVQLTDPHLFGSEPENERAFSNCVNEINARLEKGANYSFVVLTGDLGIEDLVSTKEVRK